MKRSRLSLCLALVALSACSSTDTTSPSARPVQNAADRAVFDAANGTYHDGTLVPGSVGQAGSAPSAGDQKHLACNIVSPLYGQATIGSNGGILYIGQNALIIPPGALTKTVVVSGTVDAGNSFKIDFQPHGLQFKKPAGLIIDASSCNNVPNNVVYLDEQGGIAQRITAIFSNWWHLIAAPLDHFSTYMIDV